MLDILGRLYRIARSRLDRGDNGFGRFVPGDESDFDKDARFSMGDEGGRQGSYPRGDFAVPREVREDLTVFQLTPPSSLQEVRSARNREIKKYHSDKFINDPNKLKASKEIMQIYNAAYDRLKTYYEKR